MQPGPTSSATPTDAPRDVRRALKRGLHRARQAYGDLGLDEASFQQGVLARWVRGRERLGLPTQEDDLRRTAGDLHLQELYVALACEHGGEDAWRVFRRIYEPDLRSGAADDAERVARVLADVGRPPPGGGARTLLGTYEGAAPLWAWLATVAALAGDDAAAVNDVAALAAGDLEPAARLALEERVSASPGAAVVGAVAEEAKSRAGRMGSRSIWTWALPAGAVVLAAFGVWIFLAGGDARLPLGDADLERAFTVLRVAEAETFAGVEPLLAEERRGRPEGAAQGGVQLARPQGTIADVRPRFEWTASSAGGPFVVEVLDAERNVVAIITGASPLAWPDAAPALERGRAYQWKLTGRAAGMGRFSDARSFRVATPDDVARLQRALAAIDARDLGDMGPVVKAHCAIRLGFLGRALDVLEDDSGLRAKWLRLETRAWARAQLGLGEE